MGFTLTQTSLLPLARTPSSKLASKESLRKWSEVKMIRGKFMNMMSISPTHKSQLFFSAYQFWPFMFVYIIHYLSVDMNFFVAPRTNSTANIWGFSVLRIMANTYWQNINSWLLPSDQTPFSQIQYQHIVKAERWGEFRETTE